MVGLSLKYGGIAAGSSSTPGGRGRRYSSGSVGGYYNDNSTGSNVHLNATGLNYSGLSTNAASRGSSPPPPFRAAPQSAMREYNTSSTTPRSSSVTNYNFGSATTTNNNDEYIPNLYNSNNVRSASVSSVANPDGSKNHLSYRSMSPTFMYRAPQPQEVEMVSGNPNILKSEATYGPPSPTANENSDRYAAPAAGSYSYHHSPQQTPPPPPFAPPPPSTMRWNRNQENNEDLERIQQQQQEMYDDEEEDGEEGMMGVGIELVPLPPYPNEDQPVVPKGLLPPSELSMSRFDWELHPTSHIVITLLRDRGIVLPHHNQIVKYHMAKGFLDYLSVVTTGAFFVKYKRANAAPKERFMRVAVDGGVPYLMWTLHDKSYQLIDRVPLAHLVGVNANIRSLAFRRHLVSQNLIKGCHAGQHRPRLPTNGCLTLWFWDSSARKPRSVDILTTSMATHMLWKKTFDGILSVNSTSMTGKVVDMDDLRAQAEEAMAVEDSVDDE